MIIVCLSQQLGNQMFQYALGKHLELLGHEVKYYLGFYDKFPEYDLSLPRVFNLSFPQATEEEYQTFMTIRRTIVYRARRKILGIDNLYLHEMTGEFCGPKPFNRKVFSLKNGVLNGYWQSEAYFRPIADTIHRVYTFRESSLKNMEMAKTMSDQISVSIHVRRGDYAGLFPLLDEDYYINAMAYFTEKYKDVRFYVFSNDMTWCRMHLVSDTISYIDWNTGLDSPYDMWLMTQCKHNIIANSSFSWWGAWLNQNKEKEVIAPKSWDFQDNHNSDIYCPKWVLL